MQCRSHSPEWTPHEPCCTGFCLAPQKKKKRKKLFPDLQKPVFDSQSHLTAFRISLQVITVIKLHDKKNSEMVVNRSLVRLHRLSPHPLLLHYLRRSLDSNYNPASAPVSSSGSLRTVCCLPACQPALSKHSCLSNELESAK